MVVSHILSFLTYSPVPFVSSAHFEVRESLCTCGRDTIGDGAHVSQHAVCCLTDQPMNTLQFSAIGSLSKRHCTVTPPSNFSTH